MEGVHTQAECNEKPTQQKLVAGINPDMVNTVNHKGEPRRICPKCATRWAKEWHEHQKHCNGEGTRGTAHNEYMYALAGKVKPGAGATENDIKTTKTRRAPGIQQHLLNTIPNQWGKEETVEDEILAQLQVHTPDITISEVRKAID